MHRSFYIKTRLRQTHPSPTYNASIKIPTCIGILSLCDTISCHRSTVSRKNMSLFRRNSTFFRNSIGVPEHLGRLPTKGPLRSRDVRSEDLRPRGKGCGHKTPVGAWLLLYVRLIYKGKKKDGVDIFAWTNTGHWPQSAVPTLAWGACPF